MPASGPPGSGAPPQDPSKPPAPSGKRPTVGLQLKLPCASIADVQSRYGDELKERRFFIRTRQPRPVDTLVRLEALLQDGTTCFRAAAVVVRVQEAMPAGTAPEPGSEPGMSLKILAADEAGQTLIAALGGKPPPLFRAEPASGGRPADRPAPAPAAAKSPSSPPRPPAPPAAAAATAVAADPVADIDLDFEEEAPPAPAAARPAPAAPPAAPAAPAAPSRPAAASPRAAAAAPLAPPPAAPAAAAPEPDAPASGPAGGLSRRGIVIGIDLGTTNSCAAVVQKGKPLVIPSREGYNTIPSIVALSEKGKFIVGHPAKSQLLINPRNTVYGAKRLIGRQFASPAVTDLIHRFPYAIVAGARGEAAVQLGTQQLSLQKISSMVLAEVKEIAQQYLQQPVTRAVITVPAYYNDNQRQAVRHAGAMAGLFVERMVNEPTAAALAFAHGRKLSQRVLVYDLGGGTFDASVLELADNVNEVISTGGDTFLGGTDFDKVLVDHLLAGFKQAHGIDFPGDRVALQRVTDAAERAKIALSEQLEYQVKVPFVAMVDDKPYDLEQTVRREELALLTSHLIDRTLEVCAQVLAARSLKASDVDEVLLVGGQSRMPLVRERIRDFFKREPSRAVHPDEAVALGAALLAHGLDSPEPDAVLIDVLPLSVGVGLPGGRFKKVVERNTSLPHKKQLRIPASRDGQRQLEIAVFQGESERIADNEYLGTLVVPAAPRGQPAPEAYDLEFSVSAECLLTVSAVDIKTGKAITATFTTHDTPEAVRQRVAEDAASRPPTPPLPPPVPADNGVRGWMKRILPRT